MSPRQIEVDYKNNNSNAIQIYNEFGNNLGIVLSHVINMIDPGIIIIGGGLSNAFNCFSSTMFEALKMHVPSFESRNISICPSSFREKSAMVGAGLLVKTINRDY